MKKPFSVGYFSSYDRGLECLLDMWPRIKERVPKATLDIYYGWDVFDKAHSKDSARMKWKWTMLKKMRQDGVTEHGRVSHTELARAMKEIKVWAYPTEFTEIHCITALKAQEAECIPIVTSVGALKETVVIGHMVNADDIYTNVGAQNDFIDAVVLALYGDRTGKEWDNRVPNRYWSDVARQWDKALL